MRYRIPVELDDIEIDARPSVPEPVSGELVFGPRDDDWELNACLNYADAEGQWNFYADGYKTSGDILVEIASQVRWEVDTLVFPVCFNYRQYLELRLKELLMLSTSYLERPVSVPRHHKLMNLWQRLRPMLAEQGIDDPTLPGVEHIIGEFHNIDVKSDSFRYPIGADGVSPSLPGITHINLGLLRDRIEQVAHILDGLSAGISEYLDQKRQYDSEMRAEAAAYMDDGW